MIVSHRHRFIFFHNPLTASSRLVRYLESWNEEPVVDFRARMPDRPFYHNMSPTEADNAFQRLGWDFLSYRRISCVRSPYTRLPALFGRIQSEDWSWRLRARLGLSTPTFVSWLGQVVPHGRGAGGPPTERWRRFGAWSIEAWCNNRLSHVIPIEKLGQHLPQLLVELGLPRPGAIPEVLPELSEVSRLSEAAVRVIAARYSFDISAFGYAPPDCASQLAASLPASEPVARHAVSR